MLVRECASQRKAAKSQCCVQFIHRLLRLIVHCELEGLPFIHILFGLLEGAA